MNQWDELNCYSLKIVWKKKQEKKNKVKTWKSWVKMSGKIYRYFKDSFETLLSIKYTLRVRLEGRWYTNTCIQIDLVNHQQKRECINASRKLSL